MLIGISRIFFVTSILMSVLGQFAIEVYLPSMPSMAISLNVPINIVQLTIAIYVLGFAIGSIIFGTLSDKFGRKPMLLICLITGSIGSLICCLSFSINWLLIGRIIQGIGFSGVAVITRSMFKDITATREVLANIASKMGILNSLAIAFAPVIGGYIEKFLFWRMNFILLFCASIIVTLLCWYKIPETNKNIRNLTLKIVIHDYIDVLSNKQFLLYNVISTLTVTCVVAYQTISPYLLQVKLGMTPDNFGYTALIITVALIAGSILNSKIMPRRGIEKMLILGCILYTIAGVIYVTSWFFNYITVYIILVPMMLYMIGAGTVYPNCSSGAMSIFSTKAGTAASVYNCLQMVGATIGSAFVSIGHNTLNQLLLGGLFTLIGLVGIICAQILDIKLYRKIVSSPNQL